MTDTNLVGLTADVVATYVSGNKIDAAEVPALISAVHSAFATLDGSKAAAAPAVAAVPAVSVRASVKPDHLVCLEDGAKLTMLKRYLRTRYDMSPEDYRAKWNLPSDYPMVAPNYAEKRRQLAVKIGLGRKPAPTPIADAAPKAKRQRKAA